MKIRNGFISNSSSSSFVVFGPSQNYEIPQLLKTQKKQDTLKIPNTFGGETEFGRQRQNYYDFGSRLNWAVLQALYIKEIWDDEKNGIPRKYVDRVYEGENWEFVTKHHDDLEILYKVLKENLGIETIINNFDKVDSFIDHSFDDPHVSCYIDHGSNWHDNKKNVIDIFGEEPNEDSIFEWLFNSDNYIANRSDEYNDSHQLEVDHRYDFMNYEDFYSTWENPEMFENGKFKGILNENK
jgi:hypothetical protein